MEKKFEVVTKNGQRGEMSLDELKRLLDTLPNQCRMGSKVMLNDHHVRLVGFRQDNTEGYSQQELDKLNCELFRKLEGLEPESDAWYQAAKRFTDEVNRR